MQFDRLRRRDFIALFGGAAAWPLAANAQPARKPPRIALFMPKVTAEQDAAAAGVRRLQELGWTDGKNIQVDYRWIARMDLEHLRSDIAELIATAPDVIWALSNPVVAALQRSTRTTPIVFVQVADPVDSGFVGSLAKPGGNITGFTTFESAMAGKWLEILKEIAPATTNVLILHNPETAAHRAFVSAIEAVASRLKVMVATGAMRNASDIEREIEEFAHQPNAGLIPLPHPLTAGNIPLLTGLAAKHRMPAVYAFRFFAAGGGLASYGSDSLDLWRRSASYVDRILHGAKPSDLPVQAPNKFQFVVNLKTARALGLNVAPTLFARADEVIE